MKEGFQLSGGNQFLLLGWRLRTIWTLEAANSSVCSPVCVNMSMFVRDTKTKQDNNGLCFQRAQESHAVLNVQRLCCSKSTSSSPGVCVFWLLPSALPKGYLRCCTLFEQVWDFNPWGPVEITQAVCQYWNFSDFMEIDSKWYVGWTVDLKPKLSWLDWTKVQIW